MYLNCRVKRSLKCVILAVFFNTTNLCSKEEDLYRVRTLPSAMPEENSTRWVIRYLYCRGQGLNLITAKVASNKKKLQGSHTSSLCWNCHPMTADPDLDYSCVPLNNLCHFIVKTEWAEVR